MTTQIRRVVVAPDKFKGSLSAKQAAAAIARGFRAERPDVDVDEFPVADGGEGTMDMLLAHGFRPFDATVQGSLGQPVQATFLMRESTAVIETASAAGLSLVGGAGPDPDTAARASTYGVGELMLAALDQGAHQLIVGLGGSASTDGGAGALTALGARVLDSDGVPCSLGGGGLATAHQVELGELDPRLSDLEIVVACDVDNPLTGPSGAAFAYGLQKGATPEVAAALDSALSQWADVLTQACGMDLRRQPGAGAAGGLAYGLVSALAARLTPGIELLLELTDFRSVVKGADLVVVGEGSFDMQSLHGKGPVGTARLARESGAAVVALVGRCSVSKRQAAEVGIRSVYALTDLEPDEGRSMEHAERLLERAAARIAGTLPGGQGN